MNYYEISEETARTAHSMVHMSDYKPGSATDGYRAAVDEAAALVASKKAEVSPFYHDKLDALPRGVDERPQPQSGQLPQPVHFRRRRLQHEEA